MLIQQIANAPIEVQLMVAVLVWLFVRGLLAAVGGALTGKRSR
jgi:hypothetical protein